MSRDGRPPRTRQDLGAFERTVPGWHAAMAIMMLAGVIVTLRTPDIDTPHRVTALVALAAMSGVYAAVTIPPPRWPGPGRSTTYLVVLCGGMFVVLASGVDGYFLLFLAYPQLWLFGAERLRGGIIWSIVLFGCVAAASVVGNGWSADVAREVLPTLLIGLPFSFAFGGWIFLLAAESEKRAQLIVELQRAQTKLAAAHHAAGVVAERERMAREIHDTLAQGFTSIIALAQVSQVLTERDPTAAAERIGLIEQTARDNLAEARALVATFSPVALSESGLGAALERLGRRFGAETGVPVQVDVDDEIELPSQLAVVVLRAAQEALTNVRRHANAGEVALGLRRDGHDVVMTVNDDGIGFDPNRLTAADGFGLPGMRDRLADVGGALRIESAPGRGARLLARIPGQEASA